MPSEEKGRQERRRLIENGNKKLSLGTWLVPLAVILAVIYFLPRLAELLDR